MGEDYLDQFLGTAFQYGDMVEIWEIKEASLWDAGTRTDCAAGGCLKVSSGIFLASQGTLFLEHEHE